MSWAYRKFLRPLLFLQDSEKIHNRTLRALSFAGRHPLICKMLAGCYCPAELPVELFGLRFPNPVGLAAGMDKEAAAVPVWAALGFGFSELGGVTRHAQPGNPLPRMFRAIPAQALVNRMGFNNPGAESFSRSLAECRARGLWPNHPVGVNLGKSKSTPLADAAQDYTQSLRVLWPHADFFVVNVSSPNTPNLRQLQDKAALNDILISLQAANTALAKASPTPLSPKPLLVKVAPDLSFDALDEIIELVGPRAVAGIIATNTTIDRPEVTDLNLQRVYAETGGLSGRPLAARSTEVIRHIYLQTEGSLPIIGVGGIFSTDDAWAKITAGASLIQVYTGMVFEGPRIARDIVNGLHLKLKANGFSRLSQAVGSRAN